MHFAMSPFLDALVGMTQTRDCSTTRAIEIAFAFGIDQETAIPGSCRWKFIVTMSWKNVGHSRFPFCFSTNGFQLFGFRCGGTVPEQLINNAWIGGSIATVCPRCGLCYFFTTSFLGTLARHSGSPLPITMLSVISNPQPSIHRPVIKWNVMFSFSSVLSPARKLSLIHI